MARSSLASVHIDVSEDPLETPQVEPDTPFRILVAGNFSGGASRIRKPVPVDRDNFEDVLALFSPEVRLEFVNAPVPVRFRELDDFHPDRLFARLAPFRALRDMRRQLEEGILPAPPAPEMPRMSGADLLRSMMGEAPAVSAAPEARSQWDAMIHELVKPYAEAKPDPRQPALIAQTDKAITGEMRGVLHHPEFQSLEAAWRGLFFLIRRLETSDSLKVYVWDMPQAELATPEGLAAFRKVVVEETVGTPGGALWSVLAGLYYFGPEQENLLAQIALMARIAGAPFLAGVAPDVVGLTKVFENLRRSPDAKWIGLAMPRFLLRVPYGAKTDSTESFEFEEMPEPPDHQRYLWGNPAIACAYLLGDAFSRSGWQMRPGEVSEISGLPSHVFRKDGETHLKPCAEVLLTEEAASLLMDRGFMPLASVKDTDRVRLVRFQSIADPVTALSGRWK